MLNTLACTLFPPNRSGRMQARPRAAHRACRHTAHRYNHWHHLSLPHPSRDESANRLATAFLWAVRSHETPPRGNRLARRGKAMEAGDPPSLDFLVWFFGRARAFAFSTTRARVALFDRRASSAMMDGGCFRKVCFIRPCKASACFNHETTGHALHDNRSFNHAIASDALERLSYRSMLRDPRGNYAFLGC